MSSIKLKIEFSPGLMTDVFVDPPTMTKYLIPYLEAKVKDWDAYNKRYVSYRELITEYVDNDIGYIRIPRGLIKWFIKDLHDDKMIDLNNVEIVDTINDPFDITQINLGDYWKLYDVKNSKHIVLRDHQREGITNCLAQHMGIVAHPTGSGKGEEIVVLSQILQQFGQVLVLCPTGASLTSTIKRFKKYGIPFRQYHDVREHLEVDCVVVSTPKVVYNDLVGRKENFLRYVMYLISNEVHHAPSKTWDEVTLGLPNLVRSYGFSATPDIVTKESIRSSYKRDAMLRGSHGEIVHEKDSKDLHEYVSAPVILNLKYTPPKIRKDDVFEFDWNVGKRYLNTNHRLQFFSTISHIINNYSDFTSITFVSEILKQGDKLYEWYPERTAAWYGGGVVKTKCGLELDKDTIFDAIINSDIRHTIVTSHAREDVNLPTLNFALMFELAKKGLVKQATGRVTRPDSPSFLVNLSDTSPAVLKSQSSRRSKIIEEEYGSIPIVCASLDDLKRFIEKAAKVMSKTGELYADQLAVG